MPVPANLTALEFEAPSEGDPKDWARAERECFKFPARLVKKAQELLGIRQQLQRVEQKAWEERERLNNMLYGFVVRNLISIIDNSKLALAQLTSTNTAVDIALPTAETSAVEKTEVFEAVDPARATPIEEQTVKIVAVDPHAAPGARALELTSLQSIHRTVMYLLEELGARRVELLGRTYANVEVDGQKIDDPFDVLESSQKGKLSEITVREVIEDLWVTHQHGRFEVLRKGKVNC